jgi:hypothetical protein
MVPEGPSGASRTLDSADSAEPGAAPRTTIRADVGGTRSASSRLIANRSWTLPTPSSGHLVVESSCASTFSTPGAHDATKLARAEQPLPTVLMGRRPPVPVKSTRTRLYRTLARACVSARSARRARCSR